MKFATRLTLVTALAFGAFSTAHAAVETYQIQSAHSSINFGVRRFFTKIPGSFAKFEGTIVVDRDNLEKSSTTAKIDVASVNTNDEKRDGHLKNQDFFLVEKFPAISFKSKSWKKTGADTYDVAGDLTIKDVTKPVVLKTKVLGFGPGARGAQIAAFEATATINRTEFGLSYGKPAIADDVDILINIEAAKS